MGGIQQEMENSNKEEDLILDIFPRRLISSGGSTSNAMGNDKGSVLSTKSYFDIRRT